ncbi:MAG: MFS transporter [Alphaproteobacteria bacterium]|nr:MFS transporter [Alphaproteobacteria bacterium]
MPSHPVRLIAVLGLGQVVAFASSYYLLGVLADPVADALDLPVAWLFVALTGAFLISAVLSPLAGRWIDEHGGREVLSLSSLAFAAALMLLGLSPHPAIALLAILALGPGMGLGLYSAAFAVLAGVHGQAARGSITAVSLIGAAGGALGWPVSALLVESLGWRGACMVWAAAHLLLCLPAYRVWLPRRVRAPGALPGVPVAWDPTLIRLAVLFCGAWFIATALAAHLPRLLERLGFEATTAAAVAGLMGTAAIVVRAVDLFVFHRAHPVLTARLATLCHPVGAMAALVLGTPAAFAVALGQGIGNGLLSVASGVLPLVLCGPDRYGERQARMLMPARFVQAAAPALYGLALERSAALALVLSTAICGVMFAMTFGLKPR